ncbi:MAG: DNA repair protein RecN [Eubacterium sp.]|nr:DNA repair protein RecN [Eubacterium sp.]
MLVNLHIVNLALIDELDIDFRPGLNILTGETGAGKSIIIGSIGIGLGGRYDTSLLRDEEKDGLVELLFSVDETVADLLREEEIDVEDGEVLISRRLTGGRSINRINDKTVTIAKLRQVSECLISLHAQHEQRTLLKASKHLELVDKYSDKIPVLKDKVSGIYKEFKSVSDKLETMSLDETERAKKLDYIRYEINDIESARLTSGEDTELEDIYKKASNAQEIAEITGETMELVGYDSDRSAGSQLSRAVRTLNGLTKLDPGAEELVKMLTDIDALMSDFAGQLSDYASDMEYDEETLRSTEERLNLINTLKARYGSSIEDINSTLEKLKNEEEELTSYEETIASLENEKIKLHAELEKECDKLTAERKKSAKALCKTIADAMKELNFERVSFDMEFGRLSDYTSNGIDSAQFIISTNVGEDMKPLVDTASGGELSRVMLAIKSVLSESDDTPTLIFDEIDVGISGITAEKVGNMMHKLSESRQIISITHLPQIAAAADSAYVIEKKVVGEKTNTSIRSLDMDGRIKELARLLGGAKVTDSVIATAKEMLAHN